MNATAKLSSKSQTLLPRQVRERLGVKPGDTVRFRETKHGVVIEKLDHEENPFAAFHEWASEEEDRAWAHL